MQLRFEGHSDDTFGEYGAMNVDHDNCANGKPIVFQIRAPDGSGLFVWGLYSPAGAPAATPGCWVIGVQQLDEDVPLPARGIRFETAAHGYSPVLLIDAPDGTTVAYVGKERG